MGGIWHMWDKHTTVNISTVSETFNIPCSTLRYWESMGLISLDRHDNNYREYTYSSLLDISDIIYMRKLGIPVKAIKENRDLGLEDNKKLYLHKKAALDEQINSLCNTASMLNETLRLIGELEEVSKHPFAEARPDVPLLIAHTRLYDQKVWSKYFSGEYQFAGIRLGAPEHRWIWGWAAQNCGEGEELAWKYEGNDRRFVQFILKISIVDRMRSNLGEAIAYLTSLGHEIGDIIVRYVTVAQDKGERWDYYKAWIEIK